MFNNHLHYTVLHKYAFLIDSRIYIFHCRLLQLFFFHFNYQVVSLEQKAKIEDLIGSVEKLSTKKEIQRQKLGELKHVLHATEEQAESKKTMLSTQLDAVTDDLKSTKLALDEISSREKQVVI